MAMSFSELDILIKEICERPAYKIEIDADLERHSGKATIWVQHEDRIANVTVAAKPDRLRSSYDVLTSRTVASAIRMRRGAMVTFPAAKRLLIHGGSAAVTKMLTDPKHFDVIRIYYHDTIYNLT